MPSRLRSTRTVPLSLIYFADILPWAPLTRGRISKYLSSCSVYLPKYSYNAFAIAPLSLGCGKSSPSIALNRITLLGSAINLIKIPIDASFSYSWIFPAVHRRKSSPEVKTKEEKVSIPWFPNVSKVERAIDLTDSSPFLIACNNGFSPKYGKKKALIKASRSGALSGSLYRTISFSWRLLAGFTMPWVSCENAFLSDLELILVVQTTSAAVYKKPLPP